MSVFFHWIKWRLGLVPAEVWTTEAERACLARHAAGKLRLVEVGVWHGGTTRHLRRSMSSEATLFAVDPYPSGRLGISLPRIVARSEVRQVPNGRVVWLRMSGAAAAGLEMMKEQPPVDFVFVDNAQTFETLKIEWEAWSPVVAPGGVICLHDSRHWPADSPAQSSVEYARAVVLEDSRFTTVEEVDSLTVMRRLPG